jgi:hypothetical protein
MKWFLNEEAREPGEELPYIPETYNNLPEFDKAPGRCLNPIHRQAAGWCALCDSEWDNADSPALEDAMQASADRQLVEWQEKLREAEQRLVDLKAAEPRDIVAVVECRKQRNEMRERLIEAGFTVEEGTR